MTAAKLKRGQLVRVCKSQHHYEENYDQLPKGYSPLAWEEKRSWISEGPPAFEGGDRRTLDEVLAYTGGTHRSVQPEPGDLVTVVEGSTRTGGPWRENFTVVACSKLGRIYYIKKEFLEPIGGF